jgi:hypothetical protein
MAPDVLVQQLAANGRVLVAFLGGLPEEQMRWKPDPDQWSALEVLGHLLDEERADFRQRLKLVLKDPGQPWPGIDPEGWVRERSYNAQNPAEVLAAFETEREASLQWLRSLDEPDWHAQHDHPALGALRAGDLLAAWATHDLRHLRQLTNLALGYVAKLAEPFSVRYAAP